MHLTLNFCDIVLLCMCVSQLVAGRTLKQGALGQERRSAATSFGRVGTALSARRGRQR